MERVRAWLAQRGFDLTVKKGADSQVEFFDGRGVLIDGRLSPPARLATLLHECGHVSIFLARRRSKRTRVAGATWGEFLLSYGRCKPGVSVGRVSEVQEELEAWDRGEALARRLRVRLARPVFERVRTRCMMSYVRWAGRKRGEECRGRQRR